MQFSLHFFYTFTHYNAMVFAIIATSILIFLLIPFRFKVTLAVRTLDVRAKITITFAAINLLSITIFYDGKFYTQAEGKADVLEFAYKTNIIKDAVIKSADIRKFDYLIFVGLNDLFSTMQITAFLQYFSNSFNEIYKVQHKIPVSSKVSMTISDENLLDLYLIGIIQIRFANIIIKLIKKIFKGVVNGKRNNKPHRSSDVDGAQEH